MVGIYVRQSADRADSVSIETQEMLCRQDIPSDAAVQVYADYGFFGKNTDRPALCRMMQAAASAIAVLDERCAALEASLREKTNSSHLQAFPTFSECSFSMRKSIAGMLTDCAVLEQNHLYIYWKQHGSE